MARRILAGLTLGVSGLVATSVWAASQSGTIEIAPGQRRCIDLATQGFTRASINDFVTAGHKLKFVFLVKPAGATEFVEIANSGVNPVSSFSRAITKATNPSAFPGNFRTCANNMSEKPSTVSLQVAVDE